MVFESKVLAVSLVFVTLTLTHPQIGHAFGDKSPVPAPPPAAPSLTSVPAPEPVEQWCAEMEPALKRFKWEVLSPCKSGRLKADGNSVENRPLVYAEFGNPTAANRTLILSMVHPDEIVPLYMGLKLIKLLENNPKLYENSYVVIAPLVNPDGFYRTPKTRVNARGVDLNRNFLTHDWDQVALAQWKKKFRSDPRRFPGSIASSEPETLFQSRLIEKNNPQKILSIHAPLNFLDYDGPNTLTLSRFPKVYIDECLKLRSQVKAVSGGFFPGSLGNYAGQEKGIPTFTLELPTANPLHSRRYWNKFEAGIRTVIEFKVPDYASAIKAEPKT